jgi:hypothetical protein
MDGFFYSDRDALTRGTAEVVLNRVFADFGPIQSVVDVGCGVGTWLSVARNLGAERLLGIESPSFDDKALLEIREDEFVTFDLSGDWTIKDRFELGICLEVGEHLPEGSSLRLVDNLSSVCEVILFSAGVPGQGGFEHINEQWPIYWQNKFEARGLEALDCVRPFIWYDNKLPWWYRQNIYLYVKPDRASAYYSGLSNDPARRRRPIIGSDLRPRSAAKSPPDPVKDAIDDLYRSMRRLAGKARRKLSV